MIKYVIYPCAFYTLHTKELNGLNAKIYKHVYSWNPSGSTSPILLACVAGVQGEGDACIARWATFFVDKKCIFEGETDLNIHGFIYSMPSAQTSS